MIRLPSFVMVLALLGATAAHAAFHQAVIDEVHATAEDGEGFVEIRMLTFGQNVVGHSRLSAWNCDGTFKGIVLEVPGNVTNSGPDVRWIMATSTTATAGVTPDFTFPVGSLPLSCGMVCWGAPLTGTFVPENPPTWDATVSANYRDCLAYGGYTGTNSPAGTPTPLTASQQLQSLTRTGTTNDNANDFALACPTPTNNAGTTGNPVCTTTTSLAPPPTTSTTETTTSTTLAAPTTTSTSETTTTTVAASTSTTIETTTSTTLAGVTTTTTFATTTSTTQTTTTTTSSLTVTSTTATTTSSSSSSSTTTTSTTVPPPVEHHLSGKQLLIKLKPGKPAKSAVGMVSIDAAIGVGDGNGSDQDPTLNGGSVRLASSALGAFDQTYQLPAGSWKFVGKSGQNKGYKWKSKSGPITSVVLKKGKLLQVAGHGAGLSGVTLGADPKPVGVVVSLGTLRICFEFGGTTKFVSGKSFKATNAPAPTACP